MYCEPIIRTYDLSHKLEMTFVRKFAIKIKSYENETNISTEHFNIHGIMLTKS